MLFKVFCQITLVFAASQTSKSDERPAWGIPSVVLTPPENSVPPAPAFTPEQAPLAAQSTLHQRIKERYISGQCELKPTPFYMGRKIAHLKERIDLVECEEASSEKTTELKSKKVTFKTGLHEAHYFTINDNAPVPTRPLPEPRDNLIPILKRRSDVEIDMERPQKRAKMEPSYEDGSYTADPNWFILSSGPKVNENRVVIYPLYEGTTVDEVYQYYKKFGPPGSITRISVVHDELFQRPTVAFIDFANRKSAEFAILDGMKRVCAAHKILSEALTIDFCPYTFTFTQRILVVLNVKPETLQKFNIIGKFSFWTIRKRFEGGDPETGLKWSRKFEICRVSRICGFQDHPNQLQITFHSQKQLEVANKKFTEMGFRTYHIN